MSANWWERDGAESDLPASLRRGRSVYEQRFGEAPSRPVKVIVRHGEGRIVGYELADGTFVESGPCCRDPLHCERRQCWRPFGPT
jgi:hypothetical protein